MQAGILIIGSIFWDQNEIRSAWRQSRLRMAEAIDVAVPIRYGRAAISRANTYTMVFSTKAPLGTAKVVPCQAEIKSFDDLLIEAKALWLSESMKTESDSISAHWGCTALKVKDASNPLAAQWAQYTADYRADYALDHADDEAPALDASGLLQMPWPSKTNGEALTDFDLLLCIANRPTLRHGDYVGPDDIALAWLKNSSYDDYFYKNRENGIKTFQDDEILGAFWAAQPGGCGGPMF
jgi:hypothetical protein